MAAPRFTASPISACSTRSIEAWTVVSGDATSTATLMPLPSTSPIGFSIRPASAPTVKPGAVASLALAAASVISRATRLVTSDSAFSRVTESRSA